MKIINISFIVITAWLSSFHVLASEATLEETMEWVTKKLASDGCHAVEIPYNRLNHNSKRGPTRSSKAKTEQKLSNSNKGQYKLTHYYDINAQFKDDSEYKLIHEYSFFFYLHHVIGMSIHAPLLIDKPKATFLDPNEKVVCYGVELTFKKGSLKYPEDIFLVEQDQVFFYFKTKEMAIRIKKALKHAVKLTKQTESDEPF